MNPLDIAYHICDTIGADGLCHCAEQAERMAAYARPGFNPETQSIECRARVAWEADQQRALDAFDAKVMPLTVRSIDGSPCVFIAEINGREVGRMSITVLPLVHDMQIPDSTIQRKIADALFFYASGKVKAAGFSEAVVCVAKSNEKMQRYVEARSVKEEDSTVYMMGVS